jgi:2-methylcitrate dehydratase PrpD
MEVTRIFARFVVQSRYDDIPAPVRHEAARALLNWLGCAVGSARHETVECALAALLPCCGAPQATVLGRAERVDILHAALFNGLSSHVLDFDDTHVRAVHPSAPVLPALMALAEKRAISGRDLVHAFVLGVDAECRIGLSVFPEHYNVGWHITGTAGVFGAAAATGKLLGLDEQQMRWALGIAATQSSGLREMFGTMCKSLHPGRAAQSGLTAALLAQKNFTSSERAIEAPRGFANVMSTRFDPGTITDALGSRYELSSNMYKPYACGLVVHAAIDACVQLRSEHGLVPEDIDRVELRVSPLVQELTAKRDPQNGLEGKFSIFHAAAVALIHGSANESEFSDGVVRDPRVIAVRDRIFATVDTAVGKLESYATVYMRDGRVLHKHVPHALGTVQRPMSDADLEGKFRGLVQPAFTPAQADRMIDLCWRIEELADAGELARATVPGST